MKESNIGSIISQTDPLLVIINDKINDDLVKLLKSSHAFVLCKTDKKIFAYPQLVQFAQYRIDGQEYSLIRRVSCFSFNLITF